MKPKDASSQITALVEGKIESSYPYKTNRKTRRIPKTFSLPKFFANGLSYNQFLSVLIILTDLTFSCAKINNNSIVVDQDKLKKNLESAQQRATEGKVLTNLPKFFTAFEDQNALRKILVGALLAKAKTQDFDDTKFTLSLIF